MGVVPDEIERAGHEFRRIREQRFLPRASEIRPGELSRDVAGVQQRKAMAAAEFARAKDEGLVAAGDGLVHFARTTVDLDSQSAAVIGQLFPEPPPPVPDGGR